MQFLDILHRGGASAADTGSAMHYAVNRFHAHADVVQAIQEMKEHRETFPMADFPEAEKLTKLYAEDPRNATACVIHAEALLKGAYKGVWFQGTVDQIREETDGSWRVYDLKTSRIGGATIRDQHTYQLCSYAWLASKQFKREVLPGAVILARDYERRSGVVFYTYDLAKPDVQYAMDAVVRRVGDVRKGRVDPVPGDLCKWCIGVNTCFSKRREIENASA